MSSTLFDICCFLEQSHVADEMWTQSKWLYSESFNVKRISWISKMKKKTNGWGKNGLYAIRHSRQCQWGYISAVNKRFHSCTSSWLMSFSSFNGRSLIYVGCKLRIAHKIAVDEDFPVQQNRFLHLLCSRTRAVHASRTQIPSSSRSDTKPGSVLRASIWTRTRWVKPPDLLLTVNVFFKVTRDKKLK